MLKPEAIKLLIALSAVSYIGLAFWKHFEKKKRKEKVARSVELGASQFSTGNPFRGQLLVVFALAVFTAFLILSLWPE